MDTRALLLTGHGFCDIDRIEVPTSHLSCLLLLVRVRADSKVIRSVGSQKLSPPTGMLRSSFQSKVFRLGMHVNSYVNIPAGCNLKVQYRTTILDPLRRRKALPRQGDDCLQEAPWRWHGQVNEQRYAQPTVCSSEMTSSIVDDVD
jgi:hypothetical protein